MRAHLARLAPEPKAALDRWLASALSLAEVARLLLERFSISTTRPTLSRYYHDNIARMICLGAAESGSQRLTSAVQSTVLAWLNSDLPAEEVRELMRQQLGEDVPAALIEGYRERQAQPATVAGPSIPPPTSPCPDAAPAIHVAATMAQNASRASVLLDIPGAGVVRFEFIPLPGVKVGWSLDQTASASLPARDSAGGQVE